MDYFLDILDIISYTQVDAENSFYFQGGIIGHTLKSLTELLFPREGVLNWTFYRMHKKSINWDYAH